MTPIGVADAVTTALDAGVFTVTLNRPDKRNALTGAMVAMLHAALERADHGADVRLVVIRGAGRDFCAGADLEELLGSADRDPAENERDALALGTVFTAIRSLSKPVVAAVQGRALAGGAGLATACDIVLVAESATLGYPEMQRGFVPAMVMTLLRRLVGEKVALDLALTGRTVGAAEAARLGLISRVVPDGALEAELGAVVRQLLASGPSALALTKRLFMELDGRPFADGIALGARTNALARTTPEFRSAIGRFLRS